MNKLLRWGAMLGLLTSTLIGTSFMGNLRAIALPDEDIVEKLRPVPVFTITNSEGSPLLATVNDNNNSASVAGVFISKADADNFVQQLLNQNNPDLSDVRVTPVSLAEVYQMQQESENNPDRAVFFDFVANASQRNYANQLLPNYEEKCKDYNPNTSDENKKKACEFTGVPLFLATGGADNGYLTIQQGGNQIIPLFFQKEQLENMLSRLQANQPDLAASVQIQVVNLQGVIKLLRDSEDQQLNQIVLVPPQDSIEYIRNLQNQSN